MSGATRAITKGLEKAKICLLLDGGYINGLLINCVYYLDNIVNIFAILITRETTELL